LYSDTINEYFMSQRCGVETKYHKKCHLDDAVTPEKNKELSGALILNQDVVYPAGTYIDVTGGWHDAGDYNKYIGNAAVVVGILGITFEEFNVKEDFNKNNVPDIIEEIKFGVEWLLKMQDKDGGVFERVFSGWNYKGAPEYETDNKIGTNDERFLDTDKYTDIAGRFVAGVAVAARVLKTYEPDLAKKCLEAAVKGWQWIEEHPNQYDTIPFSYGRYPGNKTNVFWAAVELYQTTNDIKYLKFAEEKYREIEAVDGSLNHMSWIYQPIISLVKLYTFSNNNIVKSEIKKKLERYLKKSETVSIENPFYMRTGFIDAWEWGTNAMVLGTSFDLYFISKVFNDVSIIDRLVNYKQWVLGLNPIGYSFVVGIGEKYPKNQYTTLGKSNPIKGSVVPGLYISQNKPFYVDQLGNHRCNEATIDAAALYVFNMCISDSKTGFSIKSPLRNSKVKGDVLLQVEVISEEQVDNVEYKIDDEKEYKTLSFKNGKYETIINSKNYKDGEHLIYLRARSKDKIVGGTFFNIKVENVAKQDIKIVVLNPQPGELYIGGTEIICDVQYEGEISVVAYSIDGGKNYTPMNLKNGKYVALLLSDGKSGEINLRIKAEDKTKNVVKYEDITFFMSRSGKLQTEKFFKIVEDKGQTPIAVENRKYDDEGSVVLPDEGDSIVIEFFAATDGEYVLKHRERSGDVYWNSNTSRWDQQTYEYYPDDKSITLEKDTTTLTTTADVYGEYWGVRKTKVYLTKGKHSFKIKTKMVWAYSDYLEIMFSGDKEQNVVKPTFKLLDGFEKGKLEGWGSYKGQMSELTTAVIQDKTKYGQYALKTDFVLKDYAGLVYVNKDLDWSEFNAIELWVNSSEKIRLHFIIEEKKSKTFWGCDFRIYETDKWIKITLPFETFTVDTDYQPGDRNDKKLDLDDVYTLHISPKDPMGASFTVYIDNLSLIK